MSAIPGGNPANVGVTGGGALQGGNLNFGSVPAPNDYQGAYANALSLNQQNYGNILSGYQQTAGRQQTAQQAIEGGYGNLYNTVMGGIQGIGASQSQAINDAYAQASGNSAQQMINSGLGNTTVQQSVQRGNLLDRTKAQTGLANQLAQLQAGYQSNLGLAGLNYANQANMQNTALSGQQLNWMNSVNSPYPNAQAYGQLALQQGYANRANQLYGQLPKGVFGGGAGGGGVSGLNTGRGFGFGGMGGGAGGGGTIQQSQAGYGRPGIPNNLYDANGNPIAGQAGVAGSDTTDIYGSDLSLGGPQTVAADQAMNQGTSIAGDGAPGGGGEYSYGGDYSGGGGGYGY